MAHDKLESFRFLWDGTEGAALWAQHHAKGQLKVVFEAGRPSVRELMALRKLSDLYRDVPAQQVKQQLSSSSELDLGTYSLLEAREIEERAHALGLSLVWDATSLTSYWPVKRLPADGRLGREWEPVAIEDEGLATQIARKMLEAGVPFVGHTEVD